MADLHEISSRPQRYMVGRPEQTPFGEEPLDPQEVTEFFQQLGVEPIGTVGSRTNPVIVVEMGDQAVSQLKAEFGERMLLEEDLPLNPLLPVSEPEAETAPDPSLAPLGEGLTVRITVRGEASSSPPVSGADVLLLGQFPFPARGRTDDNGQIVLTTFGETKETLQKLYVMPQEGYWSREINRSNLDPDQDNLIRVKSLSTTLPGFPDQEVYGWGQKAMKLDQVGDRRGQGAKVGVIDSGIEQAHPDIEAAGGRDFRDQSENPEETWRQDTTGHGSHVTGTIAGLRSGKGVVGFAPEASVRSYRMFPGGTTSSLINALARCISDGVDVVNLSLGGKEAFQLLHRQIQEAKNSGVACIAAAGNSATEVMYPAAFPEVLAVSAIGKPGTSPDDSTHTGQIGQHKSPDGQYFTARFTCFGSQVDVCAPGVAVVSTVPPNHGYRSMDGTSMACPHVTGLAALVMAHREDVPELRQRNSQRVDKLFEILKESADDLRLPAAYQGAGLPNALKALKLKPSDGGPGPEDPWKKLAELLEEAVKIAKAQVRA